MNRNALFIFILIFVATVLFALVSLYNKSMPSAGGKLQVTASFYPVYFFSQEIGGEKANVVNITPAGAEPHEYEPSPQDLAHIEQSRLLVLAGNGLEAWGSDIEKNIDPQHTLVAAAGEGIANRNITEEGALVVDPHVWLSPVLAQRMVERILGGLVSVDPQNKEYYENNAANLITQLNQLDTEYRNGLSKCLQRDIITAHAAFGYLAAAYGLNEISITGLSPDAEPSPQELGRIAVLARTRGIRYIFFESLVSPKLAQTLAREVGAQTLVLNPLEGLSDEELARGENYLTVMKSNLTNLEIALQCTQ